MIKLMIVAGDRAAGLAEHLNKTGAFRIDYAFWSLVQNQDKIRNSIIRVDKLLYVYQPDDSNGVTTVCEDMIFLKKLLMSDGFFSTSEVLFLQKDSPFAEQASAYFNTVMRECNNALTKSNRNKAEIIYSIKTVKGTLSFQSVHDYLLGTTVAEDFSNTISKVYRYEKGSEAKTAYVPEKLHDSFIEPFSFENLELYEKAKEDSAKFDAGVVVHDKREEDISVIENPVLGSLYISQVYPKKNTFIVTGGDKSGKSVWGTALAVSSLKAKVRTFMLDLTQSGNLKNTLGKFDITFTENMMLELLCPTEPLKSFISVCRPTPAEMEVFIEFLQLMYRDEVLEKFDQVIILADRDAVQTVQRNVSAYLNRIFYCAYPLASDVDKLGRYVTGHGNAPFTILCGDRLQLGVKEEYLQPAVLKERLPGNCRVVAPIRFSNMNLDSTIYEKLMRGEQV